MKGMKDSKTLWAWVGGVIVVVACIAYVVWYFSAAGNGGTIGSVTTAPPGQLVAGFPRDLILDNAAQVGNSYSIDYSSSTNQYTAEWVSSSSISSLYSAYAQYFAANGWSVVNSSTQTPTFYNLYAVTSTADANVVMGTGADGLDVTISYVKK